MFVAALILFTQPSKSISTEVNKNENDPNIIDYTRHIQALLATEVMDKNRVKVRVGPILQACGSKIYKEQFRLSKKEISTYIIKRLFEIRSGNDENAKFLKERTEDEISIILSGILTHIRMYQVGFRNSIEFSFDIKAVKKEEYCRLIERNIDNL
jgi:hypothetical protein